MREKQHYFKLYILYISYTYLILYIIYYIFMSMLYVVRTCLVVAMVHMVVIIDKLKLFRPVFLTMVLQREDLSLATHS